MSEEIVEPQEETIPVVQKAPFDHQVGTLQKKKLRNVDPSYVEKKRKIPSQNVEPYASVTNIKQSRHGKETAKQNVEKGNLSSLQNPSKTTKILPSGGFCSIVANVNKQKPLKVGLTEPYG